MGEPYLTLPFSAGAAIRGQIRRNLKKAAWGMGLEIEFEEDKGFFESTYRVTVSGGTAEKLQRFADAIDEWFGDIAT